MFHPRSVLTIYYSSFGDPNARPPTPQESPTAIFSSPLLQTPKQNTTGGTHFDETSSWTPRFAEEYSVFNSTPGNLRGSASGADFNNLFAPLSPALQSTGKKRSHSTEATSFDTVTHANQLSAHPAILATVNPAPRLPSSPEPLPLPPKDAVTDSPDATRRASHVQIQQGQRSAKKPRRTSVASVASAADKSPFLAQRQTQTATPPPSSKGGRKLAPKPLASSMQNQSFPQPDFSSAPPQQPHLNTAFATGNPDDVFGYPMGPATAPPIAGHRPFWGFDLDTSGMAIDVDLSAAGTDLFQSPAQNRQMNSVDWGRANDMFQPTGMVEQPNQQTPQQEQAHTSPQQQTQSLRQSQSARRTRPLAPKTTNMSTPNMQTPSQDFNFGQYQMSMNSNPFNASPGGVDPGILFSQQPLSTGMDSNMMAMSMSMSRDSVSQPTSSAPANMEKTTTHRNTEAAVPAAVASAGTEQLPVERKGSGSGQSQVQQRKLLSRPRAISPTKNSGRPNLSRSFSESARGGKRTVGNNRNPLPALAPARPITVHQPNIPPPPASQGNSRTQTQSGLSNGRRSPVKSLQHHRLSSLTSIPENGSHSLAKSNKAKRASVKFVIDENGRARAETIAGDDDESESDAGNEPMLPVSKGSAQRNSWAGPLSTSTPLPINDEDYSSSSDDEPIIIPSRNASFNYPDPPKSSGSANSRPPTTSSIVPQNRMRHRSFSDRPPFRQSSHLDPVHDAMDVDPPQQHQHHQPRPSTGGSLGDAAAELRKVMQAENLRRPGSGQPPPPLSSAESSGLRQRFTPGQRSSSSTISEASLPTTSPSQGQEQNQVRCVCNRPEAGEGAYLVKWYVSALCSPSLFYGDMIRALCFMLYSATAIQHGGLFTRLTPTNPLTKAYVHGSCAHALALAKAKTPHSSCMTINKQTNKQTNS